MEFCEYQRLAQRTSHLKGLEQLSNGLMGLNGEAGECIDILKKHLYQGHALDKMKIVDEAGDCLWYLAEIASGLGISLEEIAWHNREKLKKRYPDGFEAERSVNRG